MPILSIQSHVAYGQVGNSVAVLALQTLGREVWPIHTVQFATHTGLGPPVGSRLDAGTLSAMVRRLDDLGLLDGCAAVLTGYLGDAELGDAVLEAVRRVRRRNPAARWCCDPVMGDSGRGLFVDDRVAGFFRTNWREADILIPNAFELAELTGCRTSTPDETVAAYRNLLAQGPATVAVTGLRFAPGLVTTVAATAEGVWSGDMPEIAVDGRPDGAGDLFAAVFLARLLDGAGPPQAAAGAAATVSAALGRGGLSVVAVRDAVQAPGELPAYTRIG